MHSTEEMEQIRGDLFSHMNSFEYRWHLVDERVARIRRITAHEQLASAAMLPAKAKGRAQRLRHWSDMVREVGWHERSYVSEVVTVHGVVS